MTRSMKTLFALAASAMFATAAHAQQQAPSGVVLGVAGGLSQFNDSCEGVTTCDKTDRALRLNAGYGLGNGLVVEAVSFNFGKLKGSGFGISAEIEAKAFGGGVAYYAPVSASSQLLFRLGVAKVKATAKATGFGFTSTDSESQTAAYAGLGYAWSVTPSTAVELAWETTNLKYGGEKEAVSAATVGVSFRF